jgi:beta-mannosidase
MKSANLKLSVEIVGRGWLTAVDLFIVNNKTEETVGKTSVNIIPGQETRVAEATLTVPDIQLWWPWGYGDQALYTVKAHARLLHNNSYPFDFATISRSFGSRKAELIEVGNLHGRSFYFRINNVGIFCGGSCWIPADSFLTRLTREDYRAWIKLAADSNQNMLRVWGGGIYEADALYDAADELGVLIWQEFMFYCANYPAYPLYLANVEKEAIQNIHRLRNHPSIVLWAGNNEDYQSIEHLSLRYDPSTQDYNSWLRANFPARYIYEICLPRIMKAECTSVPYRPSSPFGNGSSFGDIHQRNVWGGNMEPYQRLPDIGGRFVSEFGMQAYPHVSMLKKCITRDEDRYPGKFSRPNLTTLLLTYQVRWVAKLSRVTFRQYYPRSVSLELFLSLSIADILPCHL